MPNTNKSPGTLIVNTIFPWCRLDYLGLRLQCARPLLWQIDPNYGILWQPVCHFCVGSVPIAVLVILNFLWRFLFWFAVFSIVSYLAVTQEWMCTAYCFLYLWFFDILLLQIKYPPQPFSLTRVIIPKCAKKHRPSQTRWIAFQRRFPTFAIQCLQCVTLITE